MSYPIIKNAGIPKLRANYPFPDMDVGDAFDVPFGEDEKVLVRGKVSAATATWIKSHPGQKFITRQQPNNTIRCIRIS